MENVTKETLLYEIEEKINLLKEEKINLINEDKNNPNLPNLNERMKSLVLIKSELIRENKSNSYHLTKSEEIVLLNSMAGKRQQNIKDYTDNGRIELAEAEKKELDIINEFLPKMPTEEEIKTFISNVIDIHLSAQGDGYILSMKDMKPIKEIVGETYPTVNGKLIKDVLMERINGSHS